MFGNRTGWIGGILVAAFAVAGCSDSMGPQGDASLSLQLTDAAGDVDQAWVEITEITLQGEAPGEQGSLVLLDEPTELIDLTTLQGDGPEARFDLVDDTEIPSGTYGQLRLHIGDAMIVTEGGEVFSRSDRTPPGAEGEVDGFLNCPSCSQTGIKINLGQDGLRLENEAKLLMLDFDVSQSFGREAGQSGMWVMHPVIRSSEVETSGTIAGSVSSEVEIPACGGADRSVEDFVPLAIAGEEEDPASGSVSEDGSYTIDFLVPGEYATGYEDGIEFESETLEFTASASTDTARVESASTATVDYTIMAATCG